MNQDHITEQSLVTLRYKIISDDLGNYILMDSLNDIIVGKVRNQKLAARVAQKLNRACLEERISNTKH